MPLAETIHKFGKRLFYCLILVLAVLALRGIGSHAFLLLLAVIYGSVFAAVSRSFRADVARFFSECRKQPDRWRSALALAGLPLLLLCLANGRGISSYDNYGAMATTGALLTHGTTELTEFLGGQAKAEELCRTQYWLVCLPEGVYSAYPIGMVVPAAPVFLAAKLVGTDLTNHRNLWRLAKLTSILLAVFIISMTFLICLRLTNVTGAFLACLFLSVCSGLLSTIGQGLWSHDLVCAGLIFCLYRLLRQQAPSTRDAVFIGIALSLMFAGRVVAAVLIAPVWLFLAWRNWRLAMLAAGVALVALLPWGWYYHSVFQEVLGPQMRLAKGVSGGFALSNLPEGLEGLLISPGTGLFIYQPWVLLPVVFFRRNLVEAFPRPWLYLCVGLVLALLFTMASWIGWTGQFCWGTRYLVEIQPILAVLSAIPLAFLWQLPWGRLTARGLLFWGFLIHGTFVFGKAGTWSHMSSQVEDTIPLGTPNREILIINKRCLNWGEPAFLFPFFQRSQKPKSL